MVVTTLLRDLEGETHFGHPSVLGYHGRETWLWRQSVVTTAGLLDSQSINCVGHLVREPTAIIDQPVVSLVVVVVIIPNKFYALFTLNKQGWITRKQDDAVASGQGHETLDLPPSRFD